MCRMHTVTEIDDLSSFLDNGSELCASQVDFN